MNLPVLPTCGHCRHLDIRIGVRAVQFVCKRPLPDVVLNGKVQPQTPRDLVVEPDDEGKRRPPTPPIWCPFQRPVTSYEGW